MPQLFVFNETLLFLRCFLSFHISFNLDLNVVRPLNTSYKFMLINKTRCTIKGGGSVLDKGVFRQDLKPSKKC